jgi:hypothetical protein
MQPQQPHPLCSLHPLPLIGENEKGATWRLPTRPSAEWMAGHRAAGTEFGRHYHQGLSPAKSPEVFVLLAGELDLWGVDVRTGSSFRTRVQAPVAIHIRPWLWHSLTARTPVVFVEQNSLEEHAADTFYDFDPLAPLATPPSLA